MVKKSWLLISIFNLGLAAAVAGETISVGPDVKSYAKVGGVSGNLNSIGSDTMNNLMTYWAEGFNKVYPNVKVQIEGKGSTTAPPALISGTAQMGPMSRAMKPTEIDAFEKKYGYKPTAIRTALDALAVYVNKDNPLKGLCIPQIDAIFSKTRKGKYKEDIKTWGQLGLTGEWSTRPISLYGRNSASGTYGYFKEHALYKGDFKDTVKEQPGSASVIQGVAADRYAIGYSGIGYKTSGVIAVPLSLKEGEPYKEAEIKNVMNGSYPLARFLYIYINKKPGQPLDPLVREFVKYILSKEGQEVAVKDGFLPLPASVVEEELKKSE
ncbi:MAG: PstS family phosphate ABC transporter substrate-binding protein [Candidatus Brocadia sp. AMX2]|uniref:Phosphate-binding protein n=1 Tax=Candidatus Brocadia sinica JPN1 TaxID=1197129 RepID=A0ABQ0K2V2_9BACT|nr:MULTISPECIES: PstS family phosphate ABC transporter substrate-binding protein [Brocadia]MBC6932303.1 PstS family phosphate ABC transporter substrate-binding protein [Candidatus Brocadia sp.]MBL1169799.1 PstS family phosphate ABC transporter substrate-binding protein [Candidatus Brocadia sp. AMX1]MCK6469280.1 PstS family phosphate ABC transporter substrate-binding protein [Candidatus Brocadia sinica]NOG40365.1 PstS family phosphate ABC transporter substrate-binding protein [Planctomycetota ba